MLCGNHLKINFLEVIYIKVTDYNYFTLVKFEKCLSYQVTKILKWETSNHGLLLPKLQQVYVVLHGMDEKPLQIRHKTDENIHRCEPQNKAKQMNNNLNILFLATIASIQLTPIKEINVIMLLPSVFGRMCKYQPLRNVSVALKWMHDGVNNTKLIANFLITSTENCSQ